MKIAWNQLKRGVLSAGHFGLALGVALLLGTLSVSPARAEGLLKPGEIIAAVSAGDAHLVRINSEPPFEMEPTIVLDADVGPVGFLDVAIANDRTIYALSWTAIWKIDVRSREAAVVYEFAPGADAVAIELLPPEGDLLVLAGRWPNEGQITLIDAEAYTETMVVSDVVLASTNVSTANMRVSPAGRVFVRAYNTPTPSEPHTHEIDIAMATVTPLWPAGGPQFFLDGAMDFDRATGDLVLADLAFIVSADPDLHYAPDLVVPTPVIARSLTLDQSGRVLFHDTIAGVVRYDPADDSVSGFPYSVRSPFEIVFSQCNNGLDDDGDGLWDFDPDGPGGPLQGDPDCVDNEDNRESTYCSDGLDNDNDGLTDAADADCLDGEGAYDPRSDGEITECNDGEGSGDIDAYPLGVPTDYADIFDPECINAYDDSEFPECADGLDNDGDGQIDWAEDFTCGFEPSFDCEDETLPCPQVRPPDCDNGWDDDGDGFIDLEDPNCGGQWFLRSELPACQDGIDNDQDGKLDLGLDFNPQDGDFDDPGEIYPDEDCDKVSGTGELPACSDGKDNDVDGLIDFGLYGDPGCESYLDQNERARCGDGVDNDSDGLTDYPEDPDCRDEEDPSETTRACSDGIDNDGDGLTDHPADPECMSPEGLKEANGPTCATAGIQITASTWLLALLGLLFMRRRRTACSRRHGASRGVIAFLILTAIPLGVAAQGGSGSGQFTGLSTAPEANMFSGSMSTSVPIQVPPGRKNVTPQLQLGYSSGGGSGPFGYGWSLPLGTVERSTKYGRPTCESEGGHIRDFVLSLSGGTMELLDNGPLNPPVKRRYLAKVDESFLEAIADETPPGQQSPTYNSWEVHDRAGMTYRFGLDPTGVSRVFHKFDRFMYEDVSPLDLCEFTSIWALDEIVDPNGNNMLVKWFKHENTLYPDEVLYGANAQAGLNEHPFRVTFVRSSRASLGGSAIEQSHRGVKERIEHIVTRIEVSYRPMFGEDYEIIRAYDLTYIAHNGRLLLATVDDDDTIAGDLLPPQTFTYATDSVDHEEQASIGVPFGELSNVTRRYSPQTFKSVMDMNGDGVSDLVIADTASRQWTVYPGVAGGTGGFMGAAITWQLGSGVPSAWNHNSVAVTGQCWNNGIDQCYQDDDSDMPPNVSTQTWYTTVDMTGDAIPDYVDSNRTPWHVYEGKCTGPTTCSFADAPIDWAAPAKYAQLDTRSGTTSTTTQVLMDVSGDGRPDFIYGNDAYLNNGEGFETAPDAVWSWGGGSSNDTKVTKQWIDFNGDGLLDLVSMGIGDSLQLQLNEGRRLSSPPIIIPTPAGANGVSDAVRAGALTQTHTALVDVNGDGLPDRVYWLGHYDDWGYGNSGWAVQLNLGGTGLEPLSDGVPTRVWSTSLGPIRQSQDYNGIHNTRGQVDVMDLNADGFIDYVNAAAGTVHLGKPDGVMAQPMAMLSAHNGIGGVTSVSYMRTNPLDHTTSDPERHYGLPFVNWVVEAITKSDGLSPDLVQSFDYQGGLFDLNTREFRGFETVTAADSDGNQSVTTYSQADFTKGKVLSTRQFAGLDLVREETSVWHTRVAPFPLVRTQVYLAEKKSQEFDLSGSGYDRCVLNRNEPPDDYGRVSHTCSLSCGQDQAAPGSCANPQVGQIDTETTWAEPVLGSSVRERPLSVTTRYINAQGQSETLAKKHFFYDTGFPCDPEPGSGWPDCGYEHNNGAGQVNQGNVRRVETLVSESPEYWTTLWNTYDGFGNIVEVKDPEKNTSFSIYDTQFFSLYPVTERNALLHEVHTETDLRYGKPTQKTGANGEVALMSYDGLGRPLCEAAPGQTLDNCHSSGPFTHSKEYRYHHGDPGAGFEGKLSYIEVRTREPNADGDATTDSSDDYLVSRQYTDGLGRKRLATSQTVIGVDTALSTVVVDHLDYGMGGRIDRKFVPYKWIGPVVPDPGVDYTEYHYELNGGSATDPAGRAHKVIAPDDKETLSYFEGKRTRVLNAQGTPHANETHAIEDDFGRVVERQAFDAGGFASRFENTYDGMGRVLTERVWGDDNTLVTHAYDLLGRETSLTDPDSGTWTFVYDDNGNVLSRDDPEPGQRVQWVYDELNRVTHVCTFEDDTYVSLADDCGTAQGVHVESEYIYDSLAVPYSKGRLTQVNDESGYEAFVYDVRGRVVGQMRDVLGVSATTGVAYDDNDRVAETIYPDGETVEQSYGLAGQLVRAATASGSSNVVYVSDIEYDLLGRAQEVVHGNGVNDVRSYYGAEENFRLKTIETKSGANDHLSLEYAYNALNKVDRITDHRNPSGDLSNDAQYVYDPLGRLTRWERGGSVEDVFSYNEVGNIIEKGGQPMHYANPARPHQLTSYAGKTFTYNENGERLTKGGESYEYDALGRLTGVTTAVGDTVDYLYDYSGRRTAKRVNSGEWTRYFSSAAESEIDDEGKGWLIKYYFAGDSRVAMAKKRTDDFVGAGAAPVPFSVPSWFWLLLGGGVFALFLVPGRREVRLGVGVGPARAMGSALLVLAVSGPALVGLTGCAPNTQQIRHYHADHLGSTQAVTNLAGALVQQARYEPYGEVRGRFDGAGAPIADTDQYRHEFTGYESEVESGLQYAGARYFDPEVAQFISHDPERQYASPYAYGPGDPMNGADPDGRFFGVLTVALILASAIAAGIDAYRATGNLGDAFKAAGMSLAMSVVTAGLFHAGGLLVQSVASTLAQSAVAANALKIGMMGNAAYGVAKGVKNGQYAGALVGALSLGYTAYGIAKSANGESTSRGANGDHEVGDLADYRGVTADNADPRASGTLSDAGLPQGNARRAELEHGLAQARAELERQATIDQFGTVMESASPGPITTPPGSPIYAPPADSTIFSDLSGVGTLVGMGCAFTGAACVAAGGFFGAMSTANTAHKMMNAPTWKERLQIFGQSRVSKGIGKVTKFPSKAPRGVCPMGCK